MRTSPTLDDDAAVVSALRAGDDAVFTALIDRYHTSFVRVAASIVHDRMAAEDVAQDTWLAVLRGIEGFEHRSSLRTWLYRILVNIAHTRARKDRRTVAMSGGGRNGDDDEHVLDLTERADLAGDARWWSLSPCADDDPEQWTVTRETRKAIQAALTTLPERQRVVVELRDIEGMDADEVSDLLALSPGNQRVLLHRARTKLRKALLGYVALGSGPVPPRPERAASCTGEPTFGRRRLSRIPSSSHAATM
jgi:RNA polymerase sigma-70 factor (ECF subfamily)